MKAYFQSVKEAVVYQYHENSMTEVVARASGIGTGIDIVASVLQGL